MPHQSLFRPARAGSLAMSLFILVPIISACDQVPGLSSAAALARKGDAKACTHQETVETAKAVIRGHPSREPSPEEIRALSVSLSGTVMLASDKGVSVTCETTVSITGRNDSTFTYMVVPAADGGSEIQIRLPSGGNEAIGTYSTAQADWERQPTARPADTDPEPNSVGPAATARVAPRLRATQVSLIQEWSDANSDCRGGSDETQVAEGCLLRDELDNQLVSSGLCYGREGEFEAEHEWHLCQADSMR